LALLSELARQGCIGEPVKVDRILVASNLGVSAWTLSKWIRRLIEEGYVEAISRGGGKKYVITEKGLKVLNDYVNELAAWLRGRSRIILEGRVFRGLGEGAYYVSLREYRDWFKRVLGFEPYPGTLNVRLDEDSIPRRKQLEALNGVAIPAFQSGSTLYCSAKVFRAVVNKNVEAAVVIPEKSAYGPDVVEIVARKRLRDELNLKDGDKVTVEVIL